MGSNRSVAYGLGRCAPEASDGIWAPAIGVMCAPVLLVISQRARDCTIQAQVVALYCPGTYCCIIQCPPRNMEKGVEDFDFRVLEGRLRRFRAWVKYLGSCAMDQRHFRLVLVLAASVIFICGLRAWGAHTRP